MKWITRERIRVNRTATCWPIRRFLDPEPEFLFAPAEEVASIQAERTGTGFDAPGATYPHADFKDQLDDHPAAHGLQLISRGLPSVTKNDHETADRAAFMYDALYASISEIERLQLEIERDEP